METLMAGQIGQSQRLCLDLDLQDNGLKQFTKELTSNPVISYTKESLQAS